MRCARPILNACSSPRVGPGCRLPDYAPTAVALAIALHRRARCGGRKATARRADRLLLEAARSQPLRGDHRAELFAPTWSIRAAADLAVIGHGAPMSRRRGRCWRKPALHHERRSGLVHPLVRLPVVECSVMRGRGSIRVNDVESSRAKLGRATVVVLHHGGAACIRVAIEGHDPAAVAEVPLLVTAAESFSLVRSRARRQSSRHPDHHHRSKHPAIVHHVRRSPLAPHYEWLCERYSE